MSETKTEINGNSGNKHVCPVRQELKHHMYHRSASLSDVEKSFLSSLLIDDPPNSDEELLKKNIESATNVLTNDMLFSVPCGDLSAENNSDGDQLSLIHI